MTQSVNLTTNNMFIQPQKIQKNEQRNINQPKTDEVNFSTKTKSLEIKKIYSPSFAGSGSN